MEMEMEMEMGKTHYRHLLIMTVLSFVAMYVLMYAMVNRFANVFSSLNQFYMAGLMTMPMVIIEMVVMKDMYKKQRWNVIILVASTVAGIAFFAFIRQQAGITDKQFLRSMIPHHAGAILMCSEAPVRDPEVLALCRDILVSQQREIDQMKALLANR